MTRKPHVTSIPIKPPHKVTCRTRAGLRLLGCSRQGMAVSRWLVPKTARDVASSDEFVR